MDILFLFKNSSEEINKTNLLGKWVKQLKKTPCILLLLDRHENTIVYYYNVQ